jgi:acyl-CoA synthetase (AMP-forming)/AMP-acid ligase II
MFLDKSSEVARSLHGAGLKRNDVISVISENRHEFPVVSFGAFYLNATVAPISALYTERKFN